MKSMLKSILNVHGASDNYLSCSERACPTWLDSYIYKYVNIPYCWTETYFEYGFITRSGQPPGRLHADIPN